MQIPNDRSAQCPSGVTSKPAIRGHFKTGQRNRAQNMFVLP